MKQFVVVGRTRSRRTGAGFSLVELMIAVAIFALSLRFGMPAYGDWIASRKLANHAEYLVETLNLARSEAVKRGMRVNLCKSRDATQCDPHAKWESGWVMFADENRDGQMEATENFIRHEGPPGDGITVAANGPLKDYVSYTSYGYARMLNGALQMGTFVVCKSGQNAIHIVLANSGRARLVRTPQPCP
ncbi:MAG TPA: GspH/FimT family pseudopilin [Casimicrobiaceae bacterium]|jgi:type IV fimbrial biogenesis protein FimT|nr:GspH/FimT family pseudopilin [Casimicrobiaceae bacterium]